MAASSSYDCRISKQYLCQAALLLCGISIMAFTAVEGYKGYVVFVWSYGVFLGGYHYSLKMYIYEKVRARNFARAWGFAQSSMGLPILVSVPLLSMYLFFIIIPRLKRISIDTVFFYLAWINDNGPSHAGYVMSAAFVILGSLVMVLIDVHKKNLREKRRTCKQMRLNQQNNVLNTLQAVNEVKILDDADPSSLSVVDPIPFALARQNSFTDQDDILPPVSLLSHQRSFIYDDFIDMNLPDCSIYSEEGIADMEYPENILFDDYDFLDNITSCNKVENCLMLSEYEQNLIKETEGGPIASSSFSLRRMGRKWSLLRQPTLQTIHSESEDASTSTRGPEPHKVLFNLGVLEE